MGKSLSEKLMIGTGALAILLLGGRVLQLLGSGALLAKKKPAKDAAEGRDA